MGGNAMNNDREFTRNNGDRTLLVGRTGNGKSGTGNSILGRTAFRSMHCSSGVTTTCQLQRTQLDDGNILKLIDTPGYLIQQDKMGGSAMNNDPEITTDNGDRTLLLVGRTGDGKSATGNSILGRTAFRSMHCSSGVTTTCQLQWSQLDDGNMLNVIDTPGLFNITRGPDYVLNELVKCIDLANDGVHAVLLVLSIRTRFSREEQATFQSFLDLFGSKISDYMIVVFTGGDEFYENDETLNDYLGLCPEALQGTLSMCGERRVLFDNKTKDPKRIADQLRNLLLHVNSVVEKNGGKPYTSDLFKDLKVNSTLLLDIKHLEEEVGKERVARLEAEETAKVAQKKREDMSRLMRAIFGRQRQRPTEELQARNLSFPGICLIL